MSSPDRAALRFFIPSFNDNQLCTYCTTFSSRVFRADDLNLQARCSILGFGAGGKETTLRRPSSEHWSNASLRKQAGSAPQGLWHRTPLPPSPPPSLTHTHTV